MSSKLTLEQLDDLATYRRQRPAFRQAVMDHKVARRVPLGPHLTLYFEDAMTIRYQVLEMMRAEQITDPEALQEELDAYNPLIPDGSNWKATMMIEYEDENERREALARLVGIETQVWLQVEGFERIYPIANEDLPRSSEDKTSAVHFLRFELDRPMSAALKRGGHIYAGCDHPHYRVAPQLLNEESAYALTRDLH